MRQYPVRIRLVVTLPNCTMGETNYSKDHSIRSWLLETYIEVTTSQP